MSEATTTDGTDPGAATLTDAQRWRAFGVAVAVAVVTILDLTKVNVALPSIESSLNAASTELQLVVSGYVLTFGLTLVPMGRLGDQRSRRVLFIVGLSLYTATSLLCALAPSSEALLIGRLLQGVAAGIQMPQVLGLVQQLFHGAERGKAFGVFGACVGVSTAIGPTLGGLLIAIGGEANGWRLIFWMNVPLCLIAIALAIWMLPDLQPPNRGRLDLDPVGVVLFGIALLALLAPFLLTTGAPSDDERRWWTLVLFLVFAAIFAAWERRYAARGRSPLVPFALFRISSFRNGVLLGLAYFAALPALFLTTTLFLQDGLGLSALQAGMVGIGFASISAVASWFGGSLVNTLGRPLVVGGLVILGIAVAVLAACAYFLPAHIAPWAMAAAMALGGFGGGVVISPNQTLSLADVPVAEAGLAGSMSQLGQRIGTAIGTAVALALFYATVYAETGTKANLDVYHDAYAHGLIAVGVFLALALAVGSLDILSRRRVTASPR